MVEILIAEGGMLHIQDNSYHLYLLFLILISSFPLHPACGRCHLPCQFSIQMGVMFLLQLTAGFYAVCAFSS